MMMLAILLHSAWNAGAVFTIVGGARTMFAMPGFDFVGALLALGGAGLLFVLMSGMVAAFFIINPRLRAGNPVAPIPVQEEEPSHASPMDQIDDEDGKVK